MINIYVELRKAQLALSVLTIQHLQGDSRRL